MRSWLLRAATASVPVVLCFAMATTVQAVTDEEIFRTFRFNFINPGGRALGVGGAVIATVDDATALQANPAMMVYLVKKEFFAEVRSVKFDENIFSDRTLPSTAVLEGQVPVGRIDDITSPSNMAFVHPFEIGQRRFAWGIGRQELLTTNSVVDQAELDFTLPTFGPGERITYGSSGRLDLEIIQYNLSIAAQVTEDWSLGVTNSFSTMDITSVSSVDIEDLDGLVFVPGNPKDPIGEQQDVPGFVVEIPGESDDAHTFSIGIHWEPRSKSRGGRAPFRLGIVYNRGARFEVPQTITPVGLPPETSVFTLKVPDRYGLGFGYERFLGRQNLGQLIWSVDVVGVKYEDLLEGFVTNRNGFTSFRLDDPSDPTAELVTPVMAIDNGIEYRTGLEYRNRLAKGWRYSLRAGYARLPASDIFAERIRGADDPEFENLLLQYFAQGKELNTFSGGTSFSYTSRKFAFQIDAAFAVNEDSKEGVVSTIWRF